MSKTLLTPPWQKSLAHAITEPAALLQILELNPALLAKAEAAARQFPLRVPHEFVARMQKGNVRDPLLLQVLPLHAELRETAGYSPDPLQEKSANPLQGLLHKYHGRVLLMPTSACAIHCRYCFRREFPYEENKLGSQNIEKILDYIRARPEINEIILSGGDPLAVNDRLLQKLGDQLLTIPHLRTLRFHTRLPIVLPSRISQEFIAWIKHYPLRKVMVIHCNHPNEIDTSVTQALQKLRTANVTLLNQNVLLKDINDDAQTLITLSEQLFSAGVLPYYLHLLDKVRGTAHFAVSLAKAKRLRKMMQETLPGYLVPKFVKEVPGCPHKMEL